MIASGFDERMTTPIVNANWTASIISTAPVALNSVSSNYLLST